MGFAFVASTAHAELVIDTFGTGQMLQLAEEQDVAVGNVAAADAVGGFRTLVLTRIEGMPTEPTQPVVSVNDLDLGWLIFGSPFSETRLEIIWDGTEGALAPGVDPGGLGGLDLAGDGSLEAFAIDLNTDNPIDLTVRVFEANDSTGASWAELTVPVEATPGGGFDIDAPQFERIRLPFAEFTVNGPAGVTSLVEAGAIVMRVEGPEGLDLVVDAVQVVPEPAGGAWAAGAVLAWLGLSRRRNVLRKSGPGLRDT